MRFESQLRRGKESAHGLLLRPEKEKQDEFFTLEKDVDPYWDRMVNYVKSIYSGSQAPYVHRLLVLHPERRHTLGSLANEGRWLKYKKDLISRNHLSPDNHVIEEAYKVAPFAHHRSELTNLPPLADRYWKYISDKMQYQQYEFAFQLVYDFFILYPERYSDENVEMMWQLFSQKVRSRYPQTDPEKYTRHWKTEALIALNAVMPSFRHSDTMKKEAKEIYADLPRIRKRRNWLEYINSTTLLSIITAERVEFSSSGPRLEQKIEEKTPPRVQLPQRNIV